MSEPVSRWWETAAGSLLSTTTDLAIVKDILAYLPLPQGFARDCLAARSNETLLKLQPGLEQGPPHDLSGRPRGSRELARFLTEKISKSVIHSEPSRYINAGLDHRTLDENAHDRFSRVPFSQWVSEALGIRTPLIKNLYAWARGIQQRADVHYEPDGFMHPLTDWIVNRRETNPGEMLHFLEGIRTMFKPGNSLEDNLPRLRVLDFRLQEFVREPGKLEWEQLQADFKLYEFCRSVAQMEDIHRLAEELTEGDFRRFQLHSRVDVEKKSSAFRELCNAWYRLHNWVAECHFLLPQSWITLDILQCTLGAMSNLCSASAVIEGMRTSSIRYGGPEANQTAPDLQPGQPHGSVLEAVLRFRCWALPNPMPFLLEGVNRPEVEQLDLYFIQVHNFSLHRHRSKDLVQRQDFSKASLMRQEARPPETNSSTIVRPDNSESTQSGQDDHKVGKLREKRSIRNMFSRKRPGVHPGKSS